MNKKENIQAEIDKTLNVLADIKKVEADAFFYTRVKAKIEHAPRSSWLNVVFDSPALKPILISVLLFINILAIGLLFQHSNQELSADQVAEQFNQEYYITQASESDFYLNEN